MRALDLIAAKRDGAAHSAAELDFLIAGAVDGSIPDYQLAAWLMACVLRGLDDAETDALTAAMVASGETVALPGVEGVVCDKHSTGGVGDKVTIALAPLVAACGVPVAKMSGRGLGHTGGTLDKLEAIPGFRIGLSNEAFARQVAAVGCAVVAQSERLVPADRVLYALRDATATVPSIGLIAASVMSKKLAVADEALLLDVKVGAGAFLRDLDEARRLARLMQGIGTRAGRRVACELTRMDQPLGLTIGNALEAAEAFELLRGAGAADLDEVVRRSAVELLVLAGRCGDRSEAAEVVAGAIASGAAVERAERWVAAQGGDPRVVGDPWAVLPRAPILRTVAAPAGGWVAAAEALPLGLAAVRLGAGRAAKGDAVDPAVGIALVAKPGDRVERGAPLAVVHARDGASAEQAAREVLAAFTIGAERPVVPDVLIETIR